MFENFCSDIIQTTKCFALENFNLTCQAEHTKINSRLNLNPGLALIAFLNNPPLCYIINRLIAFTNGSFNLAQVGKFFKKVFSGWKRKREIERMRNDLFEQHIRRRRFISKLICEGIVGGGCKGLFVKKKTGN